MNRADKGAFWVTGGRCAHRKSPRMGRTQRLKNEKWPWKPPPTNLSYVRLAAIRALLMGVPRAQVCRLYHRRDRLIRLWIERFNRGGIDALASKPRTGRPPKVRWERLQDLLVPVLEDPSKAGELHGTGVKLHGWLKSQLALELGYRTVIRSLHQLDYPLRVPRTWPERQDEAARAAFLEALRPLQDDPNVELWFADECGVEGDPRPRRRWVARGSWPRVPYLGDHIRASVVGAVCPQGGQGFALIFEGVDTDAFPPFLDQLAQAVPPPPGKRRLLIVDNASWHKAARLNWRHFEPRFLPAYRPDLNPIERLWLRLKADWFADFLAKTPQALVKRLIVGLTAFLEDPPTVAAQCAFRK